MKPGRGRLGALLVALLATVLLATVVVWRFERLHAWWWNATRGVAVVRT